MSSQYPQQGFQQAPVPVTPPKKMSTGKKVAIIVAGILVGPIIPMASCAVLIGAATEAPKKVEKPDAEERKLDNEKAGAKGHESDDEELNDVTLGDVTSGEFSTSVPVTIKNNSSKRSTYWVSVEFLDAKGQRVDESGTSAVGLAPGQTKVGKVSALKEISGGEQAKIVKVTRYAS